MTRIEMLKILLATIAGTIAYFVVGWLVFEGLLCKYMSANTPANAAGAVLGQTGG